jgi:hypothetical protein
MYIMLMSSMCGATARSQKKASAHRSSWRRARTGAIPEALCEYVRALTDAADADTHAYARPIKRSTSSSSELSQPPSSLHLPGTLRRRSKRLARSSRRHAPCSHQAERQVLGFADKRMSSAQGCDFRGRCGRLLVRVGATYPSPRPPRAPSRAF